MGLDTHTHEALGLHNPPPVEANGHGNGDILQYVNHPGDAPYHPCPEAFPGADVAAGKVTKFADWTQTRRYPDTLRDLFVYLPPGYSSHSLDPQQPLRLLVCNDGIGYLSRRGDVRATTVLDNLHAAGEIEPTAAIFVNPGRPQGQAPKGMSPYYDKAMLQRSLEYDSMTPVYGEFLREDVLPFVSAETGAAFSEDPAHRTVCGISSGGICAFTAGWFHTESFGRVLSHCGSYTAIRGGHNYPYLIRTTPRKNLRIYLQSGTNDGRTLFGDWPLANQTMAAALEYAGYDHHFEFGVGGHSLRHAGAVFADSLRWLWREH